MESDIKILMVCLGNICRSPLAQGVMEQKVQLHGLHNWTIDSAGTGNWHVGNPPDPRSINTARKHGLDISKQRARQFSISDFENFDVIIAMDQKNKQYLLRMATNHQHKMKVLSLMEMAYDIAEDVPDPYFDGNFEEVYNILDGSVERAIDFLKNYKV